MSFPDRAPAGKIGPMSNEIHGHDVLHLLDAAEPCLTRETLATEATRLWGAKARFHTCSTEGMTLDELVDMLVQKGKVVDEGGALRVNFGRVCSSGQHAH